MSLSKEDKLRILNALKEDEEFRYAVAGLIGVSEILKRLDHIEDNQNKLWKEVRDLSEGQNKLWENTKKLWENTDKLWENTGKLWETTNKLLEEVRRLSEAQNVMLKTLNRLATTVDRLTISVEEEARDVIRHRLKQEMDLDVILDRLIVDGIEMNIYGATGDTCVFGEATVRLGKSLLEELERKINSLKRIKPDLFRPKMIKVVYTDYATPEAIEMARNMGIWLLKWGGDLTQRRYLN